MSVSLPWEHWVADFGPSDWPFILQPGIARLREPSQAAHRVELMINVKTKPQSSLRLQAVGQRTTFRVLERIPRGSSWGVITVAVPKAGKMIADGSEIKRVQVTVKKESRARIEVELKPAVRRAVERYGRIRANIRLSYVPKGAHPITKTVPLIFGYRQSNTL
jgi:hypothetical protein